MIGSNINTYIIWSVHIFASYAHMLICEVLLWCYEFCPSNVIGQNSRHHKYIYQKILTKKSKNETI